LDKLKTRNQLGKSAVWVPSIIFGTSCLGNLYEALEDEVKLEIIRQWFEWVSPPIVIDCAGKYGAGLALEVIGNGLRELGIKSEDIVISNKLGWIRTSLTTPEPTFEPGVWEGLQNDAIQKINYRGIKECWEQGNELIGEGFKSEILSVHDPDEFVSSAKTEKERQEKLKDVVEAYIALDELKRSGQAKAIGVGAKDWKIIREINKHVELDWVMLAVSLTIMNHPTELLEFVSELKNKGIGIINSALFHAGFLTGGAFFDYKRVNRDDPEERSLFSWRDGFFKICERFRINPAAACVQFGISPAGVVSVALNTSQPKRVKQNVELVQAEVPDKFWRAMKEEGLIRKDYPFVG